MTWIISVGSKCHHKCHERGREKFDIQTPVLRRKEQRANLNSLQKLKQARYRFPLESSEECSHTDTFGCQNFQRINFGCKISLCLRLIRILVIIFRNHPNNFRYSLHLKLLNLVTSTKTLFSI